MSRARGAANPGIALSELGGVRYLHFDGDAVQGAMRIRKPDVIVLEYVRRMCGWLLLREPPERMLQLGLGAGALARWSLAQLPDTRVTAVEISDAVIGTAQLHFALPIEHPRLELVHADAGEYVAHPRRRGGFGVIQVDVYDRHARGPALDSPAFYAACRRALAPPGVAVFNLFGEHDSYAPNLARIREAFDGRVVEFPPVLEGNIVVMALAGPPLEVPVAQLHERARVVGERYGLPAERWAKALAPRHADGPVLRI